MVFNSAYSANPLVHLHPPVVPHQPPVKVVMEVVLKSAAEYSQIYRELELLGKGGFGKVGISLSE